MNIERIKELKTFSDTFYAKLNEVNKTEESLSPNQNNKILKKSLSTCSKNITSNLPNSKSPFTNLPSIKNRPVKSCRKKQSKFSNNIYKTLLPWVPPHYVGRYFEKYKRLPDHYELSSWDKVNLFIYNFII